MLWCSKAKKYINLFQILNTIYEIYLMKPLIYWENQTLSLK